MAQYTSNTYGAAAIGGSIDIEGLEEVKRVMKKTSDDSKKRRTLLKALRYGAIPTRQAMKMGTPVRTGNLRASIGTITGKGGKGGIGAASVTVGARVTKRGGRRKKGQKKYIKNDGYYVGWVIRGHKKRGGGKTTPNDFLTPAFDSTKNIAVERIVDKLIKDVLEKNW